jgi:Raf kinase inhibitor-like YbhB/YbcL family protein
VSLSRRRPWWAARLVVVVLTVAVALTGCGNDGRELRQPSAQQTTTTRPPSSDTIATAAPAPALQLTSQAFAEGGAIPDAYTCRGDDRSPSLVWSGVSEGTAELAVVVRDRDANGFVHWVVAGLSPQLGALAEDTVPDGAVEATNDFGALGWGGPCPDSGTHHYEFRLYALAQASGVTSGEAGAEAAARIEGAPSLASAALSGTFSAPPAG